MTDTRISPWRTPLYLAAIGLVLMVGGYNLMSYRPLTPHRLDQQRQLDDLRRKAEEQGQSEPDKKALADRLRSVGEQDDSPPYRLPGRLAIYVGLLMFVAAFLVMYRSRPHHEAAEEDEGEGDDFPAERAHPGERGV
jgi:hypothetical protein